MANMDIASVLAEQYERAAHNSEPERTSEAGRLPSGGETMSGRPKSLKRSVGIGRHKTSISLEDTFWLSLKEVAANQGVPVSTLLDRIDRDREDEKLSSAVRKYLLSNERRFEQRALGRTSKRS